MLNNPVGRILPIFFLLLCILGYQLIDGLYELYALSIGLIINYLMISRRESSWTGYSQIIYIILFYPFLSPVFAHLMTGSIYFSGWNQHIQTIELTNHILLQANIAAMLFVLSNIYNFKYRQRYSKSILLIKSRVTYIVVAFFVILLAYLSEPENSIISTTYSQMRPSNSLFSASAVSQLFIFGWFLLFFHRKISLKVFFMTTIITMIYLLLHARRSEPLGIIFVLIYTYREQITLRTLLFFGFPLFLIFFMLDFIRDSSLKGFSLDDFLLLIETRGFLPGGSNILITLHDVIYLITTNSQHHVFTLVDWFIRLIPTPLLNQFNVSSRLEGSYIIDSSLGYMGGMHLFSILYLNGSFFLIFLVSFIIGYFSSNANRNINYSVGINLRHVFYLLFLFYSPRIFWYHPIGFIKMFLLFLFIILIIHLFKYGKSKCI